MKPNFVKLGLLLLVLGGARAHSQTLNWSSITGASIVDSEGSPLDTTFLFQLGTFEEGFVPTEENISHWDGGFRAFDVTGYYSSEADGQYFTGTAQVEDHDGRPGAHYNDYPLFEGMRAYVLIRNQEGTEYFLASASTWIFPTKAEGCCANDLVTNWSISDLGTDSPITGAFFTQDGTSFNIRTNSIPEPGTLLVTFVACGLALVRRRRSH